MTTKCKQCSGPIARSTTLIEGHTAYRCAACNLFNVEGSSQWIPGGPDLQARLLATTDRLEEDANIIEEAMNSEWDDPRWTNYTVE